MGTRGYKKYMKKDVQNNNSLLKIFILSFFGMLLVFTFLIKSFSPTVDTSIGDYKEQITDDPLESKKIVDNRLEMIQNEDQGTSFKELMTKAEDVKKEKQESDIVIDAPTKPIEAVQQEITAPIPTVQKEKEQPKSAPQEVVYKVYIGSYTSAEQARVAKDIIQESGSGLNPIVKCIGSNNYTLQVGLFKNKQSAESMLYAVKQNNLPGRIVQDY